VTWSFGSPRLMQVSAKVHPAARGGDPLPKQSRFGEKGFQSVVDDMRGHELSAQLGSLLFAFRYRVVSSGSSIVDRCRQQSSAVLVWYDPLPSRPVSLSTAIVGISIVR
jgi:hypothetical protein